MQICALLLLVPVVSGLFFDLFKPKLKCVSPFGTSPDDTNLAKIIQGFFKCPYEPSENPNLSVDDFVRFFYIQSGQNGYNIASSADIATMINKNNTNYILIHGYTDGFQFGGESNI